MYVTQGRIKRNFNVIDSIDQVGGVYLGVSHKEQHNDLCVLNVHSLTNKRVLQGLLTADKGIGRLVSLPTPCNTISVVGMSIQNQHPDA